MLGARVVMIATLLSPSVAAAHFSGGAVAGAGGLSVGLDHLVAAALVGLLMAWGERPMRWRAPALFFTGALAAAATRALFGPAGAVSPAVEWAIAGSIPALGLLLFTGARPAPTTAALMGCGVAHGVAFGAELAAAPPGMTALVVTQLAAATVIGGCIGGLLRLRRASGAARARPADEVERGARSPRPAGG